MVQSIEEGRGQSIHHPPLKIFSRMWSAAFSPVQHTHVTGFIRGILRGVRYAKSLRVLFSHRRSPSWTTLVLYSRVVFFFNEPTNWVIRSTVCSPRGQGARGVLLVVSIRGGGHEREISNAGRQKMDFAEIGQWKPVLLGLSLAGNLVKPLLYLYGTEWRERGYGLRKNLNLCILGSYLKVILAISGS